MRDVRPGDVISPLGVLRLSVGALAEITLRLNASGPAALATRLRAMDAAAARHLLISLLRTPNAEAQVARLSDAELMAQLQGITRCIEEAFG